MIRCPTEDLGVTGLTRFSMKEFHKESKDPTVLNEKRKKCVLYKFEKRKTF
jgi:hypothetical protein